MLKSQPYTNKAALITAALISPIYEDIISEIPEETFMVLSQKLLDHLFVLNEEDLIFGDDTKEHWTPYVGTYVYITYRNGKDPKSEEELLRLTPENNPGIEIYRFKDAIKEAVLSMNDFKNVASSDITNYQLNDFAIAAILSEKNKMDLNSQSHIIATTAAEVGLI